MKRVNAAHDVLVDPTERARYDAWRTLEEEPTNSTRGDNATRDLNQCPRCLKRYRTVAGLQWHRANVESCR